MNRIRVIRALSLGGRLRRPPLTTLSALIVLVPIALLVAAVTTMFVVRKSHGLLSDKLLPNYFAYYQDLPAAGVTLLFLIMALFLRQGSSGFELRASPRTVAAIVLILCLGGTWFVFGDYPLSLDEYMATFDARILRHFALLAPIPPEWRGISRALQPDFAFAPGNVAWSSSYLPVNAALRAFFGIVGLAPATGPLLAACSLILVHGIARKLIPDDREPALIAVLLLASSSQFLLNAMTPYAMTAHLAFNLAWLWLVLDGRRRSIAAAAAVSLLACGLHQMAFHPLFVAPFLPWLWLTRRRGAALFLLGAVLLSAAFWTFYATWAADLTGIASAGNAAPTPSLIERVETLVRQAMRPASVVMMMDNLLRLAVWQNPLTWVLGAAALLTVRRQPPILWALAGGVAITFTAMILLMPYQGHGWGYRYLHGLLGNLALLGALGWKAITSATPAQTARARLWARVSLLVSVAILFPLRAYQASAFAAPYRQADAAIARSKADVVIIEDRGRWFASDLVRNDPYLRNRPVRVLARKLPLDAAARLCGRYRVEVIGRESAALAGIRAVAFRGELKAGERKAEALRSTGCVPMTEGPTSSR